MSQTLSVSTLLAVPLAPLVGALAAGILGTKFGGNWIGRRMSHSLTIFSVLLSFILSAMTLKSVALGKAFMHDGRFTTLEQVVDHYDHGVKNGPALDNRLKGPNGQPRVLNLRPTDKAALVAFLKTLTDSSFLGSARFTDPFR